jgi:hypothetical protein
LSERMRCAHDSFPSWRVNALSFNLPTHRW